MRTQESIIKEINGEWVFSSKHTWAEIKEIWGINGVISVEGSIFEPLKNWMQDGGEIDDNDTFGLLEDISQIDRLILLNQNIRAEIQYSSC